MVLAVECWWWGSLVAAVEGVCGDSGVVVVLAVRVLMVRVLMVAVLVEVLVAVEVAFGCWWWVVLMWGVIGGSGGVGVVGGGSGRCLW